MTKFLHPVAGTFALLMIATFWSASFVSELFGNHAQITAVKTAIPYGFLILIPALAIAGGTGFTRAGKRRGGVLGVKIRRMPVLAANGVLILIPAALFLSWKARHGQFDSLFYGVQLIELAAGGVNLFLLGCNMRDGFRLTGRFRRR